MTPTEELEQILSEKDKVIGQAVVNLFSDLQKASPVQSGAFRGAWDLDSGEMKWTITNNMEYASILWEGRREVGGRMLGSEQWPEGGDPMMQKFDNDLQTQLNKI